MAKQNLNEQWRLGAIRKKRGNARKTSQQILNELKREAGTDWGEVPSVRTIERYLEKMSTMTPEQLRLYTYFSWPGSMTAGALPWEASAAALELLRERTDQRMDPPTIPLAQWFWRITQVAPDAPIKDRHNMALDLASGELSEPPDYDRPLHWQLAYQTWKPENVAAYREAIDAGMIPRKYAPLALKAEDAFRLLARRRSAEGTEKQKPEPKARKGRK